MALPLSSCYSALDKTLPLFELPLENGENRLLAIGIECPSLPPASQGSSSLRQLTGEAIKVLGRPPQAEERQNSPPGGF